MKSTLAGSRRQLMVASLALLVAAVGAGCPSGATNGGTTPSADPPLPPTPTEPTPSGDDDVGAAERPPVVSEFSLDGNTLVVPGEVAFEAGTATLSADSEPALWTVVDYLAAKDSISLLRVEGHVAAGLGDEAQGLSEQRALAAARWLVGHGVACTRLIAVAFADQMPIADNATPEGRAANTRVVFVNAALRDRPIGGMPVEGSGVVAGDVCAQ